MIGQIGDARAIGPLVVALSDDSDQIRKAAAETLDCWPGARTPAKAGGVLAAKGSGRNASRSAARPLSR